MGIFDQMKMVEKVKLANAMHAFLKPDKPFVRKSFPNVQQADNTLGYLSAGIPREELIRLMKAVNIPQPVIDLLPKEAQPLAGKTTVLAREVPTFSPELLDKLGAKQKVLLYNVIHKAFHGDEHKPIRKFRNNELADTSLNCVGKNYAQAQILAFMKTAKLSADVCSMLDVPPPTVTKNGLAPVPSKKAKLQSKMAEESEEKAPPKQIRHETNPKKAKKVIISMAAQRVLAAIQTLLPDARKKAELDSTKLAEYLKTSTRFICQTVRADLYTAGLIKYEDDTPDNGAEFIYITLTELGRKFQFDPNFELVKLPAPKPGPRSKFEKASASASSQKAKSSNGNGTSRIAGDGKRIYKLVAENPRRPNTWGWKSFEALKDGMTYAEYKNAGGRNNDLAWDIEHGYAEVR